MKYKVKFRIVGDKPPFTATLHEDNIENPVVLSKTVTSSGISQSFVDANNYIISPLKEYCIKVVDSINNNVSVCDIEYPIQNLTILTNQSNINLKYLNIDENIFNNKSYNIPQLENVLLTTTPPQGYTFKNWETIPNTILNNSTDNPLNFSMLNTNFSIKPINEDNSNAFIFTIDTTLGNGDSFDLPLRSGYNYDFVVDWGDGNTDVITSYNQTEKLHTYSTGGEYQVKITGICKYFAFNYGGDRLKLTSIDQWGNTGFINMANAFYGCSNLTTVNDTDGTWCSSVTDMKFMFYGCSSLATLDVSNWDVSNVTDMSNMFYNCSSLTTLDVSSWDVSNVTTMREMFYGCSSLTTLDVSNWNVSNVSDMYSMFYGCSSLTTLDVSNWDVSNVNYMSLMFYGCSYLTTLDVSTWDVSNVIDMESMFYGCSYLTTLDVSNWDVSNVTYTSGMFYGCSSLTTLDVSNWDVSNVTEMTGMFNDCSSLTTLDVSNWNISNVTDMSSMFQNCSSLTILNVSNWDVSKVTKMKFTFQNCSSLTILNVGNWDVSKVTDIEFMFNNTPLDTPSYDALLIGWSRLPSLQPNLTFRANLAKYSSGEAATARQYIIDTYGWTIEDGDQVI